MYAKVLRACCNCHCDLDGKLTKEDIEKAHENPDQLISHGICKSCYEKLYGQFPIKDDYGY